MQSSSTTTTYVFSLKRAHARLGKTLVRPREKCLV